MPKDNNKVFLTSFNRRESDKKRFNNSKEKMLTKLCMLSKSWRMTESQERLFNIERITRILDMEDMDNMEVINLTADMVMGVRRVIVKVGMEVLLVNLSTDNNFHGKTVYFRSNTFVI